MLGQLNHRGVVFLHGVFEDQDTLAVPWRCVHRPRAIVVPQPCHGYMRFYSCTKLCEIFMAQSMRMAIIMS